MVVRDAIATLRSTNRAYTRANREDWAELGFRNMTARVHDSERDLVLAEMDVRNCAVMVALAEDAKTDKGQIRIMSQRNMAALPSTGEWAELLTLAKDTNVETEVSNMVDIAKNYVKRYHGIEAQFDKVLDEERKLVMAAKAVAYSAACAAHVRMARVLLSKATRADGTVFGAKGA